MLNRIKIIVQQNSIRAKCLRTHELKRTENELNITKKQLNRTQKEQKGSQKELSINSVQPRRPQVNLG